MVEVLVRASARDDVALVVSLMPSPGMRTSILEVLVVSLTPSPGIDTSMLEVSACAPAQDIELIEHAPFKLVAVAVELFSG
jgi:hypothetical protein